MSEKDISTAKDSKKLLDSKDVILFIQGVALLLLCLSVLYNRFYEHKRISFIVQGALAQQTQAFNKALAERDKIIQQQKEALNKMVMVYNKGFMDSNKTFKALHGRIDSIHARQNESVNALNEVIDVYDKNFDDMQDELQLTELRIGSLKDEFDFFKERATSQIMKIERMQENLNALNKFADRIYTGPLGFLRIEDEPKK